MGVVIDSSFIISDFEPMSIKKFEIDEKLFICFKMPQLF
jgi:hypothetical protein